LYKKKYYNHKFRWENWLISCHNCNVAKGQRDTREERWIDPRKDNPSVYMQVFATGALIVRGGLSTKYTERVIKTIEGADLNCVRTNRSRVLRDHRLVAVVHLEGMIKQNIELCKYTLDDLIQTQRKLIISYCSSIDQAFTGVLLEHLLTHIE
jgi:hypothetical protein